MASSIFNYEGIDIEVPSIKGIKYAIKNGALTIECKDYSGNFVLRKATGTHAERSGSTTKTKDIQKHDKCDSMVEISPILKQNTIMDEDDYLKESITNSFLQANRKESKASELLEDFESPVVEGRKSAKKGSISSKKKRGRSSAPASKKDDETESDQENSLTQEPENEPFVQVESKKMKNTTVQRKIKDLASGKATSVPLGRWGHSASLLCGKVLAVYGGDGDEESTLGDLHIYDTTTNCWSKPMNCESIPRCWHSAINVTSKGIIIVFGGERMISGVPETLSEIMVLDTEVFLWYPPVISGKTPVSRSGQTFCLIDTKAILFGGTRGRKWFNVVDSLDTESWHWESVKVCGTPPAARTYHTASSVDKNMVVFGGNSSTETFNDVHVLETNQKPWKWFQPCVVGKAPCPRTGHSATVLDSHTILVFGGWDPQMGKGRQQKVFDDAFLLDTNSWEWTEIKYEVNDCISMKRVGHSSTLLSLGSNSYKGSEILIYGGQDDLETRHSEVIRMRLSNVVLPS